MPISAETIKEYFDRYEWNYEQLDETHFLTGFNSEVADVFTIHVTIASNWVYFAIAPLVEAPENPECERELYRHLLRLCQEANMAKFSVDSDGDVILTVELPREDLDYSEFSDALGALSFYADETYPAIQSLATDPDAVSSLAEEKDLEWGE